MSAHACTVRAKCACLCVWVQLFASFHRVPLWLPSWPLMPEVPHQSHVTLVPDTLVFTVSADGRGPLQKRLSLVKRGGVCPSKPLGKLSTALVKRLQTTLKTQPCPQQMFVLRRLCSVALENKNRILMEAVVHMSHFAVEAVVGGLYQQQNYTQTPCLKSVYCT